MMCVENYLVSKDPLLVINFWDKDEAEEDYYCEDLSFVCFYELFRLLR